ncbi:MAG: hypothetical protein LBE01_06060 [Deltaproteobacteria bacterium]|jgi:hypothetical protein|nr:hypothetical protein [Deltaproteobacteria bacterium]
MKSLISFFCVGLLSMGLWAATAQAQEGGSFQFDELEVGRQSQSGQGGQGSQADWGQDDADLARRLFSDDQPSPASGQPAAPAGESSGGSFQNLPGVPSPVQTPAQPGEAKIERTDPAASRGFGSWTPRVTDYAPHQRQWFEAEEAWSKDLGNYVPPCSSLVANRILYHINCASGLKNQGR